MPRKNLYSFVVYLAGSTLLFGAPHPPSPKKLDSAWKKYSNKALGYCISYPARWMRGEAFDGAGLYFAAGLRKFSLPVGEIDVAAFKEDLSETANYLQVHLEGLRKFERAQRVESLDTNKLTVQSGTGMLTKTRYYDPQDRTDWVDELLTLNSGAILYRLELECHADQQARFEAAFMRVANSLQVDCGRGQK